MIFLYYDCTYRWVVQYYNFLLRNDMKLRFIYTVVLLLVAVYLSAKADDKQMLLNNIVNDIGKNNFGNEFFISIPPPLTDNLQNSSNTIRVYLMPLADGKINLKVQSKNYKKDLEVKAGVLAECILSPDVAQPYIKTGENLPIESNIYKNAAIQISSDIAFSCYVMVMYNNSIESFLAYPAHLLGREYSLSTYNDPVSYYPSLNSLPAITTIISPYDDNEIEFTMGGNINSKTSDGLEVGNSVRRILQKGDVWVISTSGKGADLSGSRIKSDLPVSIVSANQYSNVPLGVKSGNYTVEMEIPTRAWSKTYLIANNFNRKNSKLIRIYAKEANTDITINNYPVGTITNLVGVKDDAYLEVRLSDISNDKLFAVQSNKDIYVVSYSTGTEEDGLPIPQGGTFKQVVSSYEQYSKSMFFSIYSNSYGDFSGHYINIITETDESGNLSDSLLLYQIKLSNTVVSKVKDMKLLSVQKLNSINGKNFASVTLEIKNEGSYSITSDKPYFAEIYGNKNTLSYGMPVGLNLVDINSTDDTAPIVSWQQKCDGLIEGYCEDVADKASLPSNIGGHLFLSNESENIKLIEIDNIIPGKQKKVNWKLKVQDINQYAKAKIKFWDFASNDIDAIIEYFPSQVKFDKGVEQFGSFKIGQSAEKEIQLNNNSDKEVNISGLQLLYANRGFEIINTNPFTIPAHTAKSINVRFAALSDGNVYDSLGISDSCGVVYKVRLEANVGSPIIEVSDVDFGDNIIGSTINKKALIYNKGVSNLVINGYKLPNNSDFEVDFGRVIDPIEPLFIEPGSSFEFSVTFVVRGEQKYTDSIQFVSDAKLQDNVCLLNARGILPGLVCSSLDWGKRRIHRNDIPAGPYLPGNVEKGFVILNKGSKNLKITKYELLEQEKPESFEVNFMQINNLTIAQGEKYILPISFRPDQVGTSHIKLEITDEFNNKTQANLTGIGIVPQLSSSILDFDTVMIQNYNNPKIMQLRIRNQSYDEWQYADTVVIFDIKSIDDNISDSWLGYSKMGLKYDKAKLQFPIKLAPGESFYLPIAFAPNEIGDKYANLSVISDEYVQSTFTIKGYGIEQDFSVSNSIGETCINSKITLTNIIRNNGNTELHFYPLEFSEYASELSFLADDDVEKGFTLEPNKQKEVKIEFKPLSQIDKITNLIARTKENPDVAKSGQITARSVAYRVNTFVTPIEQTSQIGQQVSIKVNLDAKEFNQNTHINDISFNIEYNPKAIKANLSMIRIADNLEGKFIYQAQNEKSGIINIRIKSLDGSQINQATELIEVFFDTYYPNDSLNYSDIIISSLVADNKCVDLRKSMARITIKEECASNLRQFDVSDTKYSLTTIFADNKLTAKFGIGIKANCNINIYNLSGELIFDDDYGVLNVGEYTAEFNALNLSNGVYFIKLSSGPFSKIEKVLIYK
ncbi:MAG TPA: choice-of-anchor D domain-containing protein [Candidatus Kapabacteria bacterium]|nr:choice-of-anchor D domain-containing protein [Candidatus Kapabacteria bacterium]